ITVSQGVDRLTIERSGAASGPFDCNGTTYDYGAFTYQVVVDLVSGTFCLLDDSCPTPTATAMPTPTLPIPAAAEPDAGSGASTDADNPGVLSTLPTVVEAARPANALWSVALAVVLVILVALPTQLLNTAVEAGSDRVSTWLKGRRGAASTITRPLAGWRLAAGGVLAAALIASFVDPAFGVNVASLRIFASVLLSFTIDVVIGWLVVIWLVQRFRPGAAATFRFVPATLLIVVAAVLFTRLTEFQPGLVFGLVAGVVFGTVAATADKARAVLIGLGYSFAAGILGWVGYSLLATISDPSAIIVFARESLSALAIGGIAALPITLVPLRGMSGHVVWEWSRRGWAIAYAIGLVGFFFVLMPMPFSWQAVDLGIAAWVGIFVVYAVVAVGLWLMLARPWRNDDADVESD
ncbi:MAG: hypothetical protein M3Y46_09375, partial [Actinomycetota bacterium]|nr:hypothetical protein [Actinomycetota bacterium]